AKYFHTIGALEVDKHLVAVFQLLLTAHAQALGRDLFKVTVPGKEQVHRIVGNLLLRLLGLAGGQLVQNLTTAGLTVLFGDFGQFGHDDLVDARRAFQYVLQIGNGILQLLDLSGTLENVFPVQVTQFDFGYIFSLNLVDTETDHQVGNNLRFLSGVAHNLDG